MKNVQDAQAMCADPAAYFSYSINEMFSLARSDVEAMQLELLQHRFAALREELPMLQSLLKNAGIDRIDAIDDVVPLLFDHTVYKSYPPSLLAKGNFKALTRWLNKLTTHDLGKVDVSKCETIDDWMDTLAQQTPILMTHSSGTTGTVSFLPLSATDFERGGKIWPVTFLQKFGEPQSYFGECPNIPVISFMHRSSRRSTGRYSDMAAKFIAGAEERFIPLYPHKMSADLMYLAGKLRAAQARGNLQDLEISPALLARKDEFAREQANEKDAVATFLERISEEFAGQKVFAMALPHTIHQAAVSSKGAIPRELFSPDSVMFCPGGTKGASLPDDWMDSVKQLAGVDFITNAYGMSEIIGLSPICKHGNYHQVPWIIPYVLEPDTCAPLPRSGTQTGRGAFFDLGVTNHWGGFISGDEITVHWDDQCPCGMQGAYLENHIVRYSEKQGGDDKINCAATASAHQDALDFLLEA